jgi:L-ribulose-5-phosphate 3-epimerase
MAISAHPSRREILAGAAALALMPATKLILADEKKPRFKIGACDWSIGRRQKLEALDLAKTIGLDGVQISFDDIGTPTDLRSEQARNEYQQRAKRLGIEIASLAMGTLNEHPYASEERTEQWVLDCIDTMHKMEQKVVLIAFFGKGDINGKPDLQAKVTEKFKRAAPLAEKAGVILGIESWMNAADHLRMIDAIGSPAVQVWYDVANSEKMGYDIYKEIREIGKERICQFHMKENASLLGQGRIDFKKLKEAIDAIGWGGWLIIEGATVKEKTLEECYVHNQKYLRSIFT